MQLPLDDKNSFTVVDKIFRDGAFVHVPTASGKVYTQGQLDQISNFVLSQIGVESLDQPWRGIIHVQTWATLDRMMKGPFE